MSSHFLKRSARNGYILIVFIFNNNMLSIIAFI